MAVTHDGAAGGAADGQPDDPKAAAKRLLERLSVATWSWAVEREQGLPPGSNGGSAGDADRSNKGKSCVKAFT